MENKLEQQKTPTPEEIKELSPAEKIKQEYETRIKKLQEQLKNMETEKIFLFDMSGECPEGVPASEEVILKYISKFNQLPRFANRSSDGYVRSLAEGAQNRWATQDAYGKKFTNTDSSFAGQINIWTDHQLTIEQDIKDLEKNREEDLDDLFNVGR